MNGTPGLSTAEWRKSSYSNGGDANCVEVADGFLGIVPVRDSKCPEGHTLVVPDRDWGTFVDWIKA
ncbi:DUF397 domain-containing protein [Streptomyces sp. NPDC056486]|uniref:DUF397 domain-containing protein n=1 Tax=Streptomyces sp. NPDC056486 TaxID=3345835 RepID=UPI00368D8BD0